LAQIFPRWANRAPIVLVAIVAGGSFSAVLFVWYFFSPRFTDVGYQPRQPIPFSHKLHVGEMSMDCRYCHTSVEISPVASVPPTQTCMNCHRLVGQELASLALVRESELTDEPIHWIRVHDLPDYTYFDHSLHLRAGVGCVSCHGDVSMMEEIRQVEPLSMGWCIDCHQRPAPHLRPQDALLRAGPLPAAEQAPWAERRIDELSISPPIDCSGCHR